MQTAPGLEASASPELSEPFWIYQAFTEDVDSLLPTSQERALQDDVSVSNAITCDEWDQLFADCLLDIDRSIGSAKDAHCDQSGEDRLQEVDHLSKKQKPGFTGKDAARMEQQLTERLGGLGALGAAAFSNIAGGTGDSGGDSPDKQAPACDWQQAEGLAWSGHVCERPLAQDFNPALFSGGIDMGADFAASISGEPGLGQCQNKELHQAYRHSTFSYTASIDPLEFLPTLSSSYPTHLPSQPLTSSAFEYIVGSPFPSEPQGSNTGQSPSEPQGSNTGQSSIKAMSFPPDRAAELEAASTSCVETSLPNKTPAQDSVPAAAPLSAGGTQKAGRNSRLSLLAAAVASAEAKALRRSQSNKAAMEKPAASMSLHDLQATFAPAKLPSLGPRSSLDSDDHDQAKSGPSEGSDSSSQFKVQASNLFELRGGPFDGSIDKPGPAGPPIDGKKPQLRTLASGSGRRKSQVLNADLLWIQRPLEQISSPEFAIYRSAYASEIRELKAWATSYLGLRATGQQIAKAFWIACNGIARPPFRHARLVVAKSRLWVEMMRSILDTVSPGVIYHVLQVLPRAYNERRLELLDLELSTDLSLLFRQMLEAMLDLQKDACQYLGAAKAEGEAFISAAVLSGLEARVKELQVMSSGRSQSLDEYLGFAIHFDGGPVNLAVAFCALLGRCNSKAWEPGEVAGLLQKCKPVMPLCGKLVCLLYDMKCYSLELLKGLRVNAVGITMRDSFCNQQEAIVKLESKAAEVYVNMEKEIVSNSSDCTALGQCWQAAFNLVRLAVFAYALGEYANGPLKAAALMKP